MQSKDRYPIEFSGFFLALIIAVLYVGPEHTHSSGTLTHGERIAKVCPHQAAAITPALTLGMGLGTIFQRQHQQHSV